MMIAPGNRFMKTVCNNLLIQVISYEGYDNYIIVLIF